MSQVPMNRSPLSLPMIVYDLSHWHGFLLPVVVQSAIRMPVNVGEDRDAIIARIPEDFRGSFAFHINLTDSSRCPADRRALVAALVHRGIQVVNGEVLNISKRFVQSACRRAGLRSATATRKGDPSEVLIIKTNRNYGGKPEAELASSVRRTFIIPEYVTFNQQDHGYLVVPRREVPANAWDDPELVVERFIENRSRMFYRVYFLCNRFAISEGHEAALIKTIGRADRQRLLLFSTDAAGRTDTIIPPDLQIAVETVLRFVMVTAMDFGCLDIVKDDDNSFYIVDMNATAHWGAETERRIIEYLQPGDSYEQH